MSVPPFVRRSFWRDTAAILALVLLGYAARDYHEEKTRDHERLQPFGAGRSQALLAAYFDAPERIAPLLEPAEAQRILVPWLIHLRVRDAARPLLAGPTIRFDRPAAWDSVQNNVYRVLRRAYRSWNDFLYLATLQVAFWLLRASGLGTSWAFCWALFWGALPLGGRVSLALSFSPEPFALLAAFAACCAVLKRWSFAAALFIAVGSLAHERVLLVSLLQGAVLWIDRRNGARDGLRGLACAALGPLVYGWFLLNPPHGAAGAGERLLALAWEPLAAGFQELWRDPERQALRWVLAPPLVFGALVYAWILLPEEVNACLQRHRAWGGYAVAAGLLSVAEPSGLIWLGPWLLVIVGGGVSAWASAATGVLSRRFVAGFVGFLAGVHIYLVDLFVSGEWLEFSIVAWWLPERQEVGALIWKLQFHALALGAAYLFFFWRRSDAATVEARQDAAAGDGCRREA